MSRRPRCFVCGRGLSIRHRITAEERLILAIFNAPAGACQLCAEKALARLRERAAR